MILLEAHDAETPGGSPEEVVSIPVAPVVVCVTGVRAVFIQTGGDAEATVTVLLGMVVISPEMELNAKELQVVVTIQ